MNNADEPSDGDDAQAARNAVHRPIRSFVLRAGRMGSGQARALADVGPQFLLPFDAASAWNADQAFGRTAPLLVEIGFGMGQATAAFAQANPQINLLGLEVHPPGVGSLLKQIQEASLSNIRIVQHDAVEVLRTMVADASLTGIHCFFPDPWHKKRHHKRRLIQAPFAKLMAQKLAPNGYIHLATDWQAYAQQMLEVMNAEPKLSNQSPTGFVPRPETRPITKFERRGLLLGHGVWDLLHKRRAGD